MAQPKAMILSGLGLNCEEETAYAFRLAGGASDIVHVNDLIGNPDSLAQYQILAFPGGFSYGDDTGAGNALANRSRNHLWEQLSEFVEKDNLVLGICNGFQVTTNLGLQPGLNETYGDRSVALIHNDSARYNARWVDVRFSGRGPWTQGLNKMSLPIAHGEGKFYTDQEHLRLLQEKDMIAARYVSGETCAYSDLPANPNGSLDDIAGITDESGRIFSLMPHPERAIVFTQRPDWSLQKELLRRAGEELPTEGAGLQIFRNGVEYFD